MLKLRRCEICEKLDVTVLLRNKQNVCVACYSARCRAFSVMPDSVRDRVIVPTHINYNCSLDYISAQIMAFFISGGMTVSDVALQLGITRATIYRKLRKHKMLLPSVESQPIIGPTMSDLAVAGAIGRKITVKSVTSKFAAPPFACHLPGWLPEPAGNAGKD